MKAMVVIVILAALVASALAAVGHHHPGSKGPAPAPLVADQPAFVLPRFLTMTWGCDRKGQFVSRLRASRQSPTLTVRLRLPGAPARHVNVHAGQSYTTVPHPAGKETWGITAPASPATRRVLVTMRFELRPQSATCNLDDLRVAQITHSHVS